MMISRYEKIVLPQSEDGRFMAERYENDMRNMGFKVDREESTMTIEVNGSFTGDTPDEFIHKARELLKRTEVSA